VIENIRHKGLLKFWRTGDASGIHGSTTRVRRILSVLDSVKKAEDVNLPGFYFHRLAGKPIRFSVRVTANWRITFEWEGTNALNVDFEDYH